MGVHPTDHPLNPTFFPIPPYLYPNLPFTVHIKKGTHIPIYPRPTTGYNNLVNTPMGTLPYMAEH